MADVGCSAREISMLVVDPANRGQGIGSHLLDHITRVSREDGILKLQVATLYPTHQPDPVKVGLQAWYQRLGFRFLRGKTSDNTSMIRIP